MAEPSDIIPRLREMKQRNAPLDDRTSVMIEGLHLLFGSYEAVRMSLRYAAIADALVTRFMAHELASRIQSLEQRVAELESRS